MVDRKAMLLGAGVAATCLITGMVTMGNMLRADVPSFPKEWTVVEADEAQVGIMDVTMADLSQSKAGDKVTRHGCVKPTLPAWAANLPRGEARQVLLLQDLYNIGRQQAIIETNSCPCEIAYPSWDDAERQYRVLTAGKDRDGLFALAGQLGRNAGKTLKASLDICNEWRGR